MPKINRVIMDKSHKEDQNQVLLSVGKNKYRITADENDGLKIFKSSDYVADVLSVVPIAGNAIKIS